MGTTRTSAICHALFDLIIFLSSVVVLPAFLLLLSPLYLWRLFVKVSARVFARHRLGGMLSELDTFLLLRDSLNLDKSPQVVISILVTLEGHVEVNQFKSNIYNDVVNARRENGELMYERLQQRLTTWCGYPFFEWKPDFRVEDHVRVLSDLKILEENKHEFVGSRVREPFQKDCGLWDVVLVPHFNGENKTLVNLRVHHVLCDGYSILKCMMTNAMKINPQEFVFPNKHAYRHVSCLEKVSKLYRNTIGMPGRFIRETRQLNQVNPFHNPGQLVPSGKILISTTHKIPLHKFKRTKLRLKVPFTVMVNSAISSALRTYVKENDERRELGTVNGIVFVPRKGHPDHKLINYCAMGTIKMSLEPETLDGRLDSANRNFKDATTSPYGVAQHLYIKLAGKLPLSLFRQLVRNCSTSFIYSNMPGPSHPGHLWSNFMSDVMFWDPIVGTHGLSFSILSYNEYVKIGVAADSNVIKGIDKLRKMTEDIQSELDCIFQMETV